MEKHEIKLFSKTHRDLRVVFLEMENVKGLHDFARSIPGRRWSNTQRAWYVEERPGLVQELLKLVKGKAMLHYEGLREKKKPVAKSSKKRKQRRLKKAA